MSRRFWKFPLSWKFHGSFLDIDISSGGTICISPGFLIWGLTCLAVLLLTETSEHWAQILWTQITDPKYSRCGSNLDPRCRRWTHTSEKLYFHWLRETQLEDRVQDGILRSTMWVSRLEDWECLWNISILIFIASLKASTIICSTWVSSH